ncbi:MAG: LLM class flavin-dependent oxidoreductase [Aeromicrobium sp.]|uniref:LLM class flavin-dependent oxidoreductase n=1 Tax=Aeromicrobium sp. TaxID=1871063 RepID=UPI0039E55219
MLKATPAAASVPALWLLGSSMYSAELAAAKGLPYVFAHHFSGHGTEEALAHYRSHFTPSELCAEPTTFLTVNVAVAETDAEARELARPNAVNMALLRSGLPMRPLALAGDDDELPERLEPLVAAQLRKGGVGTPDAVAAHLTELADRFGVTEVMLHPTVSEHVGVDPAAAPARLASFDLLRAAL